MSITSRLKLLFGMHPKAEDLSECSMYFWRCYRNESNPTLKAHYRWLLVGLGCDEESLDA